MLSPITTVMTAAAAHSRICACIISGLGSARPMSSRHGRSESTVPMSAAASSRGTMSTAWSGTEEAAASESSWKLGNMVVL